MKGSILGTQRRFWRRTPGYELIPSKPACMLSHSTTHPSQSAAAYIDGPRVRGREKKRRNTLITKIVGGSFVLFLVEGYKIVLRFDPLPPPPFSL